MKRGKFDESKEVYDKQKKVPTPVVGGPNVDGPKSTPRRGSGAQTKARVARGPMG